VPEPLPDDRRTDPDWWREAVVYQVYPRSFADSDADGLGDLPGVTARIADLAELGVDAVWLSPFYPSAMADGGYDVSDHRDVHPQLGTLADFDTLVAEAHGHGLRVVVDIVPNHTSDEHPWFVEALAAAPGSPARDRYIFRDGQGPDGAQPPSDWISHFGGPAWTRVPDGQWYCHLFAPEQPDLDWRHPEVRADFLTTLRFWADRGVDGYRVDVAHGLAKDLSEPLRSKPDLEHHLPLDGSDPLYDRDEVHEIYREWRTLFDEYDPPLAAVAEASVPPSRRALYARPSELGQAFDFSLLQADFDARAFASVIATSLREAAATGSSSSWVLSNHDVVRHVSRYALPRGTDLDAWLLSDGTVPAPDLARGLRRARAATLLVLALPGSAYLYQGEELGLPEVADLPGEVLQDPIWLRTGHREKGRDGCRVPLPWTATGPSYGFGAAASWLPQPAGFAELAADVQAGRADSTLELYRRALRLRRSRRSPGSSAASRLDALDVDGDVLHLARPGGLRCVTNFGDEPAALPAGRVVLSSGPDPVGELPGETTVWLLEPGR